MDDPQHNLNRPVFTAAEYLAYLRTHGLAVSFPVPETLILCFQDELIQYVKKQYRTVGKKVFSADLYLLKKYERKIGVAAGFGTGAPATAAVVDLFAALGVKQFVIIGLAGGLQTELRTGNIILSTAAVRGEGVSRHYLPPGDVVHSSAELLNKVSGVFRDQNMNFQEGITWTTDAPFRELRVDILKYQKDGILAVDMEAAGVFAVAQANHCLYAAVFSVADMLADGVWRMPSDLRAAHSSLHVVFDSVCKALVEG